MSDQKNDDAGKKQGKFLGSLRDALAAASRDDTTRITGLDPITEADPPKQDMKEAHMTPPSEAEENAAPSAQDIAGDAVQDSGTPRHDIPPPLPLPSATEAAREARGGTPNIPAVDHHVEYDSPPTTRVMRQATHSEGGDMNSDQEARTQMVRGRQEVERGDFKQDPVVGWIVVVGGPGIGSFRPVFEGNNTVGRSKSNRVAIDFGDDTISAEEQAYIRYDSTDRSFLFVPNMAKTNVVSVNDNRPATAVPLQSMDVITMGRTQMVFVAFCGPEFDWGELTELKSS
ncbi:MAG: FHA domain-containing protein [Pseudomonadota bacterium]